MRLDKRVADKKAVVLLSGGLDSAAALFIAKSKGLKCYCLTLDYGQRHKKEINAARKIAKAAGCDCKILKIRLPWKGSSLLDTSISLPRARSRGRLFKSKIPSTYVPARNVIFLSFGLSYAETLGAGYIYIGAHTQDYSGYPDCRRQFFRAFNRVISCGTRSGAENRRIEIKTPLINKNKAQIIRTAFGLGVPLELTWSCYTGSKFPCGKCDSCYYRAKGFRDALLPKAGTLLQPKPRVSPKRR